MPYNYKQYKVICYDLSCKKRFTFNTALYDFTSKDSAFEFANKIKNKFIKYYNDIKVIEEKVEVIEVYKL